MPIVTNFKILKRKYSIEDFQKVLKDYPLSWPALWFKAFRNYYHEKSDVEVLMILFDYANNHKLPFSFSPYHALFHILHRWILDEWRLYQKESMSDDDLIELDKSLMYNFRDGIIRRDKFKCQLCGKSISSKTAEVHHILPRYGYIHTKHKSKKVVIGPSLPHNLITLCGDCHKKLHNIITFEQEITFDFKDEIINFDFE